MRRSVLLAILVTSSIATAQAPGETPERPAARPRDFKSHLEAAVRVGYAWASTSSNLGPTPNGSGPFVDGEALWRWRYVSVGVFGAYYTQHVQTYANDQSVATTADARYDFIDAGARVNVHFRGESWGPFVGLGLADEPVHEHGTESMCYCANNFCNPCNPGPSNQPYSQWTNLPIVEVHAGVTFPKLGPVSLELVALVSVGFNPDDSSYPLTTKRIAIGGRF